MLTGVTDNATHFGFRDVPLGDKQALVDDVFHRWRGATT